jgi:hypothetical protein
MPTAKLRSWRTIGSAPIAKCRYGGEAVEIVPPAIYLPSGSGAVLEPGFLSAASEASLAGMRAAHQHREGAGAMTRPKGMTACRRWTASNARSTV